MKKSFGILILLFAIIFPDGAFASVRSEPGVTKSDPLEFVMPCGQEIKNLCIEAIVAKLPNGKNITGTPTKRSTWLGWNEYSFPGIIFKNGTSNVVLVSEYASPTVNMCFIDVGCFTNEESFSIHIAGSDVDEKNPDTVIDDENKKIICSTNPNNCQVYKGWSLGVDLYFEVTMRITNSFTPVQVVGIVKDLNASYRKEFASTKMVISFSPIVHSTSWFGGTDSDRIAIQRSVFDTDRPTVWAYGVKNNKNTFGTCTERFAGQPLFLSTNAYWMNPPTWNSQTKILEFNLTSTHLDEKGNLNKGRFNFRINKEFAACLYPVDLLKNITATITVLYSDTGETDVSTFLAKFNDGYFEVNLENFHYSSPTIQIKLTQQESPVEIQKSDSQKVELATVVKSQAPINQAKNRIAKTITCIKGKLTKKVTGLTPKCPSGYKKK